MRQVDVDQAQLADDARADCEEQGVRRRNDCELRPAQGEGGDQPDGSERRVAEKPRSSQSASRVRRRRDILGARRRNGLEHLADDVLGQTR